MNSDEKTPFPSDDRARSDADQSVGAGSDSPTERLDGVSAPVSTPAEEASGRGSRRSRNLLIGAGAVVALLAFGGGAFAIGSEVADDDDDRPAAQAPAASDGARETQQRAGDDEDDDRDDRSATSAPVDAAALRTAADAAIAHVSAEGITSIEIERAGYDVDARLADGTEAELFVTHEGTVRERDDDSDDDDNDDPYIDLDRMGDILAAAQTAAADAGATRTAFHALSTSSSEAVYEVELRVDERDEAEVELAADLRVVRVDIDD